MTTKKCSANTSAIPTNSNQENDDDEETFYDGSEQDADVSVDTDADGSLEVGNGTGLAETSAIPTNSNQENADEEETFYDGSEQEIDVSHVSGHNTDAKDPLEIVTLDEAEAFVYDDIFGEHNEIGNSSNSESAESESRNETPPRGVISTNSDGIKMVTETIADDCELTYELTQKDEIFKPEELGYQVKINDILSDNIPFKQNVSFF